MTLQDWILIVSASIVVIGWFVNSWLKRRQEIANRRSDFRIETLKAYIAFYLEAQEKKSLDGFNDVQVAFYLYGYKDEIDLIKQIADIVTTDSNNPEWLKLMTELNILIRNRLRKELRLPRVAI